MDTAVHANSFAKGAVEMALLDLQGQILGVPVYQLLGGKCREAADCYMSASGAEVQPL